MINNSAPHNPLLQVEDLVVKFPAGRGRWVHAVSGVSFDVAQGETLGLVGESGCGKSSLARAIMHLPGPTEGRVILDGANLSALGNENLRRMRSRFQMIFQDPVSSLNPMRNVGESIEAPLRTRGGVSRPECRLRACELMEAVGLDPDRHYQRRPFQLSGGQCQRVSIARALMTGPDLLICDEPVSSLDVSVQAQIINLLRDVKLSGGLAMLFISHDLAVVKNIADRVAVMYLGRLCEVAPCADLYLAPAHPYTRALLDAVPRPDPRCFLPDTGILPGEIPSAIYPPEGCRFRTRCPRAESRCAEIQPELREIAPGHMIACHYPLHE
ncbi:MAG: peptide/nickel transport system ATP-binding [Geobacteraceae bacterium]|nr:MAG: peptide/nickel transport system ATP-binding [Geobacteraceae bacterium]